MPPSATGSRATKPRPAKRRRRAGRLGPIRVPPRVRREAPALSAALESLYAAYTQPAYVAPDPLQVVRRYADPRDQEVVGLIAATLAFGNVKGILASTGQVLQWLPAPHEDLRQTPPDAWAGRLHAFRHRYVSGVEMAALLQGMHHVLEQHGTLGDAFRAGLGPHDKTVLPALERWVAALRAGAALSKNYLLSDPARGSACKRLLMYLRWMVRDDAVDTGAWQDVGAHRLIYPMDTHMHRMARALGLTRRNTADLRAAREVTVAMAHLAPQDPVRYDFCLTRLGIRRDADLDAFVALCRGQGGRAPWWLHEGA